MDTLSVNAYRKPHSGEIPLVGGLGIISLLDTGFARAQPDYLTGLREPLYQFIPTFWGPDFP